VKNPFVFLSILVSRWDWASRQPAIAKRAILAHRYFGDEFTCRLIRAIVIHRGDWSAAAGWLESPACRLDAVVRGRVARFRQWAASLTAPARRGLLLEWKGGAL